MEFEVVCNEKKGTLRTTDVHLLFVGCTSSKKEFLLDVAYARCFVKGSIMKLQLKASELTLTFQDEESLMRFNTFRVWCYHNSEQLRLLKRKWKKETEEKDRKGSLDHKPITTTTPSLHVVIRLFL
eukprot:TRINITY_DN2191_c0_g1_i4.p1 TRINITY_DN2191_c0_g1~~TRINITY_DN2191_c0_g1_i4.p1  ORF type:complete len:126 (-),score=24.93 TRINITY_DN2191_c0_g1_i4:89-466(-)